MSLWGYELVEFGIAMGYEDLGSLGAISFCSCGVARGYEQVQN